MNWPDNKPGFERLMKLYGNDVYRMAVLKLQDAEEAKDVYQTVFLKMHCRPILILILTPSLPKHCTQPGTIHLQ